MHKFGMKAWGYLQQASWEHTCSRVAALAQVALVVRPGNKPLAETALQQYRVIESMEDLVSI